jgi:hypothetical protein
VRKNRRTEKRVKRRVPCEVFVGDARFSGMIVNLSRNGLFVQTTARPARGSQVEIRLNVETESEPIRLLAVVRRASTLPPGATSVGRGGIGVSVERADERYLRFLASLAPEVGASSIAAPAPPGRDQRATPAGREDPTTTTRYRVRIAQMGSSRSKTVFACGRTPAEASDLALAAFEEGWKVLEIEPA